MNSVDLGPYMISNPVGRSSRPRSFKPAKIDFSHLRNSNEQIKLWNCLQFSFPSNKIPIYLKDDFPDKRLMKVKEYIAWIEKASGNPSVEKFNYEIGKWMKDKNFKVWRSKRKKIQVHSSVQSIWKDPLLIAWENYKLLLC